MPREMVLALNGRGESVVPGARRPASRGDGGTPRILLRREDRADRVVAQVQAELLDAAFVDFENLDVDQHLGPRVVVGVDDPLDDGHHVRRGADGQRVRRLIGHHHRLHLAAADANDRVDGLGQLGGVAWEIGERADRLFLVLPRFWTLSGTTRMLRGLTTL
jgi:hypothetical protein